MRNIKKILTVLATVCLLSTLVIGCEKEPTVSKEELVYPVDLKAELKEGITYAADTPVNLDDFNFTLIYSDDSKETIPSNLVGDYAVISNDNGIIKVDFIYVYDEEKLLNELKEEKKAEENKEELKKNAVSNWNNMTDAEKKVVWKELGLSEKEEIAKIVYADEINSPEILGEVPLEMLLHNTSELYDAKDFYISLSDPFFVPTTHLYVTEGWHDNFNRHVVAALVLTGFTPYSEPISFGANEQELQQAMAELKTFYYTNILDIAMK